jgi:hypothetical protein
MTDIVEELKGFLRIDKHQLDEELVQNPELLFRVSDAYISAIDRRDAFKNDLAVVEAEEDKRIRHDAEMAEEKITNDAVKAQILTSKKRVGVYNKYADAKLEADRLGALKEAFAQRGYAIRDLCQLYVSNYFQENSVRSDAATDKIMYHRNRRKLAEQRAKS